MTRFIGLESETVNVARQKSCDRPQSRDTLKVEPTFNLPLLLGQDSNYGLIDRNGRLDKWQHNSCKNKSSKTFQS